MKRLACTLLALALVLSACSGKTGADAAPQATRQRPAVESAELQFAPLAEGAATATLHTSEGDIYLALYPDLSPMACQNFAGLVRQGYYDQTVFHRAAPDFVIQGGDASGTGDGGESIWGRPFYTEITPSLHHYAGALCMASSGGEADSLLSQFYIVAAPAGNLDDTALATMRSAGVAEGVVEAYRQAGGLPYLDYGDTVFGQVYAGMDVVDRIASAPADKDGKPKNPVVVNSISLNGI